MNEILEPLIRVPGVRQVALVTEDGVPIVGVDRRRGSAGPPGGKERRAEDSGEDFEALAGIVAGWLQEITRSVDPLAWDPPTAVTLSATRGQIALLRAHGSILVAVLDRGTDPADLVVPMGAAVARVERVLRRAHRKEETSEAPRTHVEPPGPIPGRTESPTGGVAEGELFGNGVPEVSGER